MSQNAWVDVDAEFPFGTDGVVDYAFMDEPILKLSKKQPRLDSQFEDAFLDALEGFTSQK